MSDDMPLDKSTHGVFPASPQTATMGLFHSNGNPLVSRIPDVFSISYMNGLTYIEELLFAGDYGSSQRARLPHCL